MVNQTLQRYKKTINKREAIMDQIDQVISLKNKQEEIEKEEMEKQQRQNQFKSID